MRTRTVMLIALGVGFALALMSWLALSGERSDVAKAHAARERLRDDLYIKGQRAFKKLANVKFDSIEDRSALRALLERAEVTTEVEPAKLSSLLDEFAAYLDATYVHRSHDAYVAWREGAGCVPVPMEEAIPFWRVGSTYETWFGEALRPEASPNEVFRRLWEHVPALDRGERFPVAIPEPPTGVAIGVGAFEWSKPGERPSLGGRIEHELWIGDQGGTFTPYWYFKGEARGTPPERLRSTLCAEVGVIFTLANGSMQPAVHTFLWDSSVDRWILWRVSIYNTPVTSCGPIIY